MAFNVSTMRGIDCIIHLRCRFALSLCSCLRKVQSHAGDVAEDSVEQGP